jgi:imidazolonepropionase-like amidohydrolase
VRELELHQEAGFHPLEVIRHATYNGALVLGQEQEFGRILPGLAADLAIVDGNPLANLKCLYPSGGETGTDGEGVATGGVRFTIKDGWVYHAPTLFAAVRALVARERERQSGFGGKPR